jgi:hypothetical protein
MKRLADSPGAATRFFELDECLDILLPAVADPLLVATLLQLSRALRYAVWRILGDPALCGRDWLLVFLQRLWKLVGSSKEVLLYDGQENLGALNWPLFLAPCRHDTEATFRLGRGGHALFADDDEEEEFGQEWDDTMWCLPIVAYVTPWDGDQAPIWWQPACCPRRYFQWHYVARALAENVDQAIVLSHRTKRRLSQEEGWRHLFIQ